MEPGIASITVQEALLTIGLRHLSSVVTHRSPAWETPPSPQQAPAGIIGSPAVKDKLDGPK